MAILMEPLSASGLTSTSKSRFLPFLLLKLGIEDRGRFGGRVHGRAYRSGIMARFDSANGWKPTRIRGQSWAAAREAGIPAHVQRNPGRDQGETGEGARQGMPKVEREHAGDQKAEDGGMETWTPLEV